MTTDDRILDDEAGLGLSRGDTLSPGAAAAITRAARWGKYYLYALLAYLAISLLLPLVGIGASAAAFEDVGDEVGSQGRAVMIGTLLMTYAVLLALYVYPVIKFWGFTHKAPAAIVSDAQTQFVDGVADLRSTLKYFGILMLVVIGFYALVLVFAVIVGVTQFNQ